MVAHSANLKPSSRFGPAETSILPAERLCLRNMAFALELMKQADATNQKMALEEAQKIEEWVGGEVAKFKEECCRESKLGSYLLTANTGPRKFGVQLSNRGLDKTLLEQELGCLGFQSLVITPGLHNFIIQASWQDVSEERPVKRARGVEQTCGICSESKAVIVLAPCGHVLCSGCYERQTSSLAYSLVGTMQNTLRQPQRATSRSLEAPNIECLSTDVAAEQLDNAEAKGVDLLWMNGGPVKPRHVHAMALLERLPSPACDSEDGVQILFEGEGGAWVAHGDLEEVLSVACEDATLSGKGAVIFAWAGYAQWSRTQLLGEMARGSWGWAPGGVDDVRSAIAAQLGGPSLWDSLRESQRLSWAPANELSRDFEKRFPSRDSADCPQPAAHDPQAQALSVLVNQFETLRRDTAASSDAEAAPPRRPRGCEQQ
eukprot:s1777_g2.t1